MKIYYFAYGSNMDTEQMVTRIQGSEFVEIGILRDYKLAFNRKGSYREGGVASIEPEQGSYVYGVIWSFEEELLNKLDEIEDPEAYQRNTFNIIGMSQKQYECFVYTSYPQGQVAADPEYLELIITAAEKLGLPISYIHFLESFRVKSI